MDVRPVDGEGLQSSLKHACERSHRLQKGSHGFWGCQVKSRQQGRRGICDIFESGGGAECDAAGQVFTAEDGLVGVQEHRAHRVAHPVHFIVAGRRANVVDGRWQVLIQIIVEAYIAEIAPFGWGGAFTGTQFHQPAVVAIRLKRIDHSVAAGRLEIEAVCREAVHQKDRFARCLTGFSPEQLDVPAVLRRDGMQLVGPLRHGITHHERHHIAVYKKGQENRNNNHPENSRQ